MDVRSLFENIDGEALQELFTGRMGKEIRAKKLASRDRKSPIYLDATPGGTAQGPEDVAISSLLSRMMQSGVPSGMVEDRRPRGGHPVLMAYPQAFMADTIDAHPTGNFTKPLNTQNMNTRAGNNAVGNIQKPKEKPIQGLGSRASFLKTRKGVSSVGPLFIQPPAKDKRTIKVIG